MDAQPSELPARILRQLEAGTPDNAHRGPRPRSGTCRLHPPADEAPWSPPRRRRCRRTLPSRLERCEGDAGRFQGTNLGKVSCSSTLPTTLRPHTPCEHEKSGDPGPSRVLLSACPPHLLGTEHPKTKLTTETCAPCSQMLKRKSAKRTGPEDKRSSPELSCSPPQESTLKQHLVFGEAMQDTVVPSARLCDLNMMSHHRSPRAQPGTLAHPWGKAPPGVGRVRISSGCSGAPPAPVSKPPGAADGPASSWGTARRVPLFSAARMLREGGSVAILSRRGRAANSFDEWPGSLRFIQSFGSCRGNVADGILHAISSGRRLRCNRRSRVGETRARVARLGPLADFSWRKAAS